MKDVKRLAQIWWADCLPKEKKNLVEVYFPMIEDFSGLTDNMIEYMYKKEVK